VQAQIDVEPSTTQLAAAAELLQAVGIEPRLRILWALLHAEHSVNELAGHLGANPPAVSQHLAKLRELGLVTTRRQGNFVFYACDHPHVRALVSEAISHARQTGRGALSAREGTRPITPAPAAAPEPAPPASTVAATRRAPA
jgi:DNA-binding transcriptional ArsR family regulator